MWINDAISDYTFLLIEGRFYDYVCNKMKESRNRAVFEIIVLSALNKTDAFINILLCTYCIVIERQENKKPRELLRLVLYEIGLEHKLPDMAVPIIITRSSIRAYCVDATSGASLTGLFEDTTVIMLV